MYVLSSIVALVAVFCIGGINASPGGRASRLVVFIDLHQVGMSSEKPRNNPIGRSCETGVIPLCCIMIISRTFLTADVDS